MLDAVSPRMIRRGAVSPAAHEGVGIGGQDKMWRKDTAFTWQFFFFPFFPVGAMNRMHTIDPA